MTKKDDDLDKDDERRDIEGLLGSVKLKAAPPELRDKVLRAAAKSREGAAWTTPLLRRRLAACAAVMLVVSVADGLVSRAERGRFVALAGGPRPAPVRPDDEGALLAEVLGGAVYPRMMAQETAKSRRRTIRKTAADDLLQLERLTEDADESQKNLH